MVMFYGEWMSVERMALRVVSPYIRKAKRL
jgi:hypothetical protein